MERDAIWVGTSWKMNKGPAASVAAANELARMSFPAAIQPFVIPPFTSLKDVCDRLSGSRVAVGAQNMHWQDEGAWTGEISPTMISECGAELVEIGHSERRTYFGETDQTVNLKVHAALRHGLRPLVCIGDTADEYSYSVTNETLARQLKIALHGVSEDDVPQVLIAYEPVWAIGASGRPADAAFVERTHNHLRKILINIAGSSAGSAVKLLYGGSVTQDNAAGYVALPHVNGVFVGRAAWNVEHFQALAEGVIA